ncbi:MAG: ATP-dependent metallopeptidase FtsH/Yme1/Tma family protein [Gemmatimonadales bacterium]
MAISLILVAAAILAYRSFNATGSQRLDQSSFYDAVTEGRVKEVTIVPDAIGFEIRGTLHSHDTSAKRFTTYVLADRNLTRILSEERVSVKAEAPRRGSVLRLLVPWIFLLIFGAVFVFFMRRMQQGGGQVLSLRRSRAKLSSQTGKITFKDVAGVEEAKQELQEIVEFLEEPDKEMFVGIGASRVRDLFEQGRKNAPCIVFVDELDAVGRQRGAGVGGGHDEREQTLNQLLVELDGFESNDGVIVLAATNRPDVLDPALLRPGRFDRQIVVDRPDVHGREEIIRIHARKVPLNVDVELGLVARGTPGFSGAELANLVNEAALNAAGQCRETVTRADFEHAKDKGLMGSARRSLVVSEEERRAMAYHQAGHALLAHLLPEADPLHKVTILPRGRALGTTQQIPAEDRHTASRPYLLATICGLMGGRVAEDQQLNRLSSGAGDDFEHATTLARKMVTEWGMSESLGPLAFGRPAEQIFLGKEIAQHRDYSEATAAEIDREVKKIVMSCYDEARRILDERTEALTRVAEALLVHETLAAKQIAALVRGEAMQPAGEPSADGREQHEGAGRKREVGTGLSVFPEPGLRPA